MVCQVFADGRSRKKSKTLGFKSRFLEEGVAFHSKITFCSFASKHVLFLVALTCLCYSCTPFLNIHPLQFRSRFLYSSFLFFLLPSISHASISEFSRFFYFSPCSAGLSLWEVPVPSITVVHGGVGTILFSTLTGLEHGTFSAH